MEKGTAPTGSKFSARGHKQAKLPVTGYATELGYQVASYLRTPGFNVDKQQNRD